MPPWVAKGNIGNLLLGSEMPGPISRLRTVYILLQLKKLEYRGPRAWERRKRSVLQSAKVNGDWMRSPLRHLITGAGREEVMRKGGEEARSVRGMYDVCAAHGDRAAVGVDVDAQGSGLRDDETHFPLNARVQ